MRSNMVQHFPSIFNPATAEGQVGDHAMPGGLSLWMRHGDTLSTDSSLSSMHQIGPVSVETLHRDPFASCSNDAQQLDSQLGWIYSSNQLASSSYGELTSTSLPTGLMEANNLASVPSSWYRTRHHQHSMQASGMSATALLQKAAQIGVTSSTPSFFGGVEVKCHDTQVQDACEYHGLFNPSHPSVAANMASRLENAANPCCDMYSTRHQMVQKDGGGGGATRDFLGVGVQTICPSSVNGWI